MFQKDMNLFSREKWGLFNKINFFFNLDSPSCIFFSLNLRYFLKYCFFFGTQEGFMFFEFSELGFGKVRVEMFAY